MSGTVRVEGIEKTLRNINRELNGVSGRSMGGLLAAGLKVEALSKRRVPVEFGNLRGSGFTRKSPENAQAVEVGFTAAYAVYVHENLEMKMKGQPRASGLGNYWGPEGRSKFLESALIDLQDEIVRTVAAHARVST